MEIQDGEDLRRSALKSKISECIVEDGGFSEVTSRTGTYKGIRQGCVFDGEMQYWNEFRAGLSQEVFL